MQMFLVLIITWIICVYQCKSSIECNQERGTEVCCGFYPDRKTLTFKCLPENSCTYTAEQYNKYLGYIKPYRENDEKRQLMAKMLDPYMPCARALRITKTAGHLQGFAVVMTACKADPVPNE